MRRQEITQIEANLDELDVFDDVFTNDYELLSSLRRRKATRSNFGPV
jgi:hypothetical protein